MAKAKLVQIRYYMWENSKHDTGMDLTPGAIVTARNVVRDAYEEDAREEGVYETENNIVFILPKLDNGYCSPERQTKALREGADLGLIITGRSGKDLETSAKAIGLKFDSKMVVPYELPWN